MYLSLDGVMEEPSWTMPYWNEEIAKFKFDELFASDALLLGRLTYQGFAAALPSMTDKEGYTDRMNNLQKFVVSTTLTEDEWNANLIKHKEVTRTEWLEYFNLRQWRSCSHTDAA